MQSYSPTFSEKLRRRGFGLRIVQRARPKGRCFSRCFCKEGEVATRFRETTNSKNDCPGYSCASTRLGGEKPRGSILSGCQKA